MTISQSAISSPISALQLLRHTLATVAYRGGKAVRNAPPSFANFAISPDSRTPAQILAHIGDLFDWAFNLCRGEHVWHDSAPLSWEQEVQRFHRTLKAFDDYLASGAPLEFALENLFQGPVADALTHIGQINMLRRLANSPVKGENYFKANISTGAVGPEQHPPVMEFE